MKNHIVKISVNNATFRLILMMGVTLLVCSCYAKNKNSASDTESNTSTNADTNTAAGYDTNTGVDSESNSNDASDAESDTASNTGSDVDTATISYSDSTTTTHVDTHSDTNTGIVDSDSTDVLDSETDSETHTAITDTAGDTGSDTGLDSNDTDSAEAFLDISDPGFFNYLRGGFLIVTPDQADMDWDDFMDSMRLIDVETIIIQAENYYENDSDTIINYTTLKAILDEAPSNYRPTRVLIGLAKPSTTSSLADAYDSAFMERLITKSIASADRIWDSFAEHPSFAGFYLSYEGWAPDENGLGLFGEYVSQVSNHCAAKGNVHIATSFSIPESLPDPEYTKQIVPDVLNASNVTLAILRDSFENRPQDTFDIETHMVPYFSAFQEALNSTDVVLWGSVDSFDSNNDAPDRNTFFARIFTANYYCVSVITNNFPTNWYTVGPESIKATLLYHQLVFAMTGD